MENYAQEICFSPPGPGQCQPWHDYQPHSVPEPSSLLLVGLSLVIACFFLKKRTARL